MEIVFQRSFEPTIFIPSGTQDEEIVNATNEVFTVIKNTEDWEDSRLPCNLT